MKVDFFLILWIFTSVISQIFKIKLLFATLPLTHPLLVKIKLRRFHFLFRGKIIFRVTHSILMLLNTCFARHVAFKVFTDLDRIQMVMASCHTASTKTDQFLRWTSKLWMGKIGKRLLLKIRIYYLKRIKHAARAWVETAGVAKTL